MKRQDGGMTSSCGAMWSLRGLWDLQLEDVIGFMGLDPKTGPGCTRSSASD